MRTPSHDPDLELRALAGDRDAFAFHTADGVHSPEAFRTPELLLLEALAEAPPDSLLVPQANYGVVGVVMAAFADAVAMTEQSARAARLCRHNAALNDLDRTTSVAIAGHPGVFRRSFDTAALAPAGYVPCEVVRQRIVDTLAALDPGGECYLAATPETGLSRYEDTLADCCDDLTAVLERDGCTVLRGTRPASFDAPTFASPRTIHPSVEGTDLSLVTYPGLFSPASLDDGTRRLAETLAIADGARVLDLACGCGPLGIYAALTADCTVTMTDDDAVATACARQSVARSGLDPDRVDVVTGDGVAGVRDRTFDRVVANPPTHAGAGVLRDLVAGAADVLAPDGRIDLVHHRGVDFERYLDPHFREWSHVERGAYHVVTARP